MTETADTIDWTAPIPPGYWRNAKGDLVHERNIRPVDRDMDDVVRRIHGFGEPLSEQMWRFRNHTTIDIMEFLGRTMERYGARVGGRKGNVQLTTFDGRLRVQLAQADRIEVGPEIEAARALIEACISRWGKGSDKKLRALVDQAFVAGADGSLSATALLRLRRVEIDDGEWRRALDAIADALRPVGRAEYIRLYRRATPDDRWDQVPLHLATVSRPSEPALRTAPEILERRVRSAVDEARAAGMKEGAIMEVLRSAKRREAEPETETGS